MLYNWLSIIDGKMGHKGGIRCAVGKIMVCC